MLAAGSGERKMADLFNSYMDESAIEAKGMAPLKPHLDAIAAIHDKKELAHALGETLRADVDALNNTNFHTANLFGLWVAPGFQRFRSLCCPTSCRAAFNCRTASTTLAKAST